MEKPGKLETLAAAAVLSIAALASSCEKKPIAAVDVDGARKSVSGEVSDVVNNPDLLKAAKQYEAEEDWNVAAWAYRNGGNEEKARECRAKINK